ncbi:MAG: hypothetical protein ACTSX8_02380 [Alphaproteobacteria bacterium]
MSSELETKPKIEMGELVTIAPYWLDELRAELRRQDHRGTAFPIYCVMVKDRIYGVDPDFHDVEGYVWTSSDDPGAWWDTDEGFTADTGVAPEELPDRACLSGSETLTHEGVKYTLVNYITRDRHVSFHLTERAADQYIAKNRHNLDGPFVYVESQARCHEFIAVMDWVWGKGGYHR